ncbi:MAG: DUF418 domain-containing protein [Anaerolineae bacterium]|nr:DUF418 domain-containing protein [Anaerolineae bacterium]
MSHLVQPLQDRIVSLDVLRGFALFGVLLVNMLDFSGSALRTGTVGIRGSEFDQIIDVAVVFLAVTKFYLLFSFLFGVGFAVQMRRMESGQRPFVGFYLRRLVVLFVIGLAHSILLWDGDILRLYAIAGLFLLLVRRLSTPVLLGLAAVITLGGLAFFSLVPNVDQFSEMLNTQAVQLYTSGSYADLISYRASQQFVLDIQIPMVLVMFLLGLAAGRSGWLDQPERYQPVLRRWWKWALPVGLLGNVLLLVGYSTNAAWLISLGIHVGAPALSFIYLSAVLLNAGKLRALAPVGQMALTNYLTHSLVCTTLFYGYGFGWYDRLSPGLTVLLVVVIFAVQMVVSRWWMQPFRFGPVEWVWRSLTYGRIQPWFRAQTEGA